MKNLQKVKRGYNEKTRDLNFSVNCKDFREFMSCVKAIGEYNNFNEQAVAEILEEVFESSDTPMFIDDIDYSIGRQGSPVIYLNINSRELAEKIYRKLQSNYDLKFSELSRERTNIRIWFD